MRKCKIFIICFLIISILKGSVVVMAEDSADPKEAMLPSITNLYNYNDNKYFTTYKDNYYLDLKETGMFKAWGGKIFNMVANAIFGLQCMLAQIVIVVIYYAFEISFFDIFSGAINSIVQNLEQGIFNELVLICIAFVGFFYIIRMVKNQRTQVITAVLQTILILVIELSFFKAPTQILKGVDDLSKGVGHAALEGTFKATNNDKRSSSATEAVSTNLWLMFVHKPWQVFEFGNTDFAKKNEEKILGLAPESDDRQKIVDEIAKDDIHFQPNLGLSRFGLTIIYFIIFLIVALAILLLCFFMIGYQFLMILFAMMSPLIFLLALLPHFGFNTLKNWAAKVIGYGSMKAVMSLVIAIVFSFMLATYELSDKYGLLMVALVQVVCLLIVWVKREELLEGYIRFASSARQPNPATVNRALRKDASVENGFKDWVRKRKLNDEEDNSNQKYNNHGYYNGMNMNKNKKINTEQYEYNKTSETIAEQRHYDNENNMNAINSNLGNLLKVAEEILDEKYERSRHTSEEKSGQIGKAPEYSNWVKQVMNRETMNLPKFEEREKLALVNQILDMQAKGGNIEELLLLDKENNTTIARPEKIKILSDEEPVKLEISEQVEIKTISNQEAGEKFVNDFNSEYNKNYNSKFIENLIKDYGQDNVKSVLDNMKTINKKNKIENPAGYLTQSLKNNFSNVEGSNLDLKYSEVDYEGTESEGQK